jgi:hypothetical protein
MYLNRRVPAYIDRTGVYNPIEGSIYVSFCTRNDQGVRIGLVPTGDSPRIKTSFDRVVNYGELNIKIGKGERAKEKLIIEITIKL